MEAWKHVVKMIEKEAHELNQQIVGRELKLGKDILIAGTTRKLSS
jgi:hypothetical protein